MLSCVGVHDKRELAGGGSTWAAPGTPDLSNKRSPSLGGGGPIRVGGPLWFVVTPPGSVPLSRSLVSADCTLGAVGCAGVRRAWEL